MLKVMRDKELKKKVIWVVAIVIILSFGVFGTAYLITDMGAGNFAGKIFNKKISQADYAKAYDIARVQAMMRYGDNFRNVQEYLNLESKAWDRLILAHEADKRKITVYNDEIIKTIQGYEFFQQNGQFDSRMYNYIVQSAFRMNPRTFEEGIRENLQMARLFDQETQGISVTDEEVRNEFQSRNEQVQVSYVIVSPENFTDEKKYDAQKAQEFFEANKRDFLVPSAVNIEYIEIPFETPDAEASTDSESSDGTEAAIARAETLVEQLKENPDLRAVAQSNEIEILETGFFSAEEPNLKLGWSYELLNQVFGFPVKQIQGPFETSKGIVILSVLENREAYLPLYKEVTEKVKDAYLLEQAKEVTQAKAAEYREKIVDEMDKNPSKNFAQIAKDMKLEVLQTPNFNRGQYLPNIGITKDFESTAFGLDETKRISDVIETAKGFAILHLDEYTPADASEFAEQAEDIREQLLAEKKNTHFSDFMSQLRIQADLMSNIAQNRN